MKTIQEAVACLYKRCFLLRPETAWATYDFIDTCAQQMENILIYDILDNVFFRSKERELITPVKRQKHMVLAFKTKQGAATFRCVQKENTTNNEFVLFIYAEQSEEPVRNIKHRNFRMPLATITLRQARTDIPNDGKIEFFVKPYINGDIPADCNSYYEKHEDTITAAKDVSKLTIKEIIAQLDELFDNAKDAMPGVYTWNCDDVRLYYHQHNGELTVDFAPFNDKYDIEMLTAHFANESDKLPSNQAYVCTRCFPDLEEFLKNTGIAKPVGKTFTFEGYEYPLYEFDLDKIENDDWTKPENLLGNRP